MSPYWSVDVVRKTFLEYFSKKRQHQIVSSCPVVLNDPTLLFTNAGMNPFKPYFLGLQEPTNTRVCDYQKCIRAGGKHNDLEDVGQDSYHHTFFEMLGNWSFGDYFKREAIEWAWDLLINHYKLDKSRIYVTIYQGSDSVPKDNDAIAIWREFLPANRILEFDDKDNFWEMGAVGPCGPCSEVHYDLIGDRDASSLVNMDDPTVIEIWNIVFIQYDRQTDGSLKSLPNKHIDTGMGLERLSCILQNKDSNYDIDTFQRMFAKIQSLTNARPYSGKFSDQDIDGIDTAYRVIADHIRTLSFAIADQVLPSNEGRGYVLRRILRRGVNYARKLGVHPKNFFSNLVDEMVAIYGHVYPELIVNTDLLKQVLLDEEQTFAKTLDRGIKLFNTVAEQTKSKTISGADAFKLYDTFGFPMDLTRLLAKEQGFTINEVDFENEMLAAKERSKKQITNKEQHLELDTHLITQLQQMNIAFTDDSYKYTTNEVATTVLQIFHKEQKFIKEFNKSDIIGVVLSNTCCYGESGGQLGDLGYINAPEFSFKILDTKKFNQYVLHIGQIIDGTLSINKEAVVSIDVGYRKLLLQHHSGTHVLNFALRQVMGDLVDQKGSLVASDKLRFDFSSNKPPTNKELTKIEEIVNAEIKANKVVYAQDVDLSTAKLINGLRAVFGEVYPDPVRVVSIGADINKMLVDPLNEKWRDYSIEFCGGTHVKNSKDIGDFIIIEESSIAKGVRRIIGVTGSLTREFHLRTENMAEKINNLEKIKLDNPELEGLIKELGLLLDETSLPLLKKNDFKDKFGAIKKRFGDHDKDKKQLIVKELTDELVAYFEQNLEAKAFVKIVSIGNDKKLLQQALGPLKSLPNKAAVLLNVDKIEKKVAFQAQIGKVILRINLGSSEIGLLCKGSVGTSSSTFGSKNGRKK